MNYVSVTDLINRLSEREVIELTNPNTRADTVNVTVAGAAIADGQGLVDSYLGQRVSLPLETVPQLVKTLTLDLAIYYLHNKVGNAGKESMPAKLYDGALKQLERFASGETSLGLHIPEGEEPSAEIEIDSEDRQFTRKKMGGLT